MMKKILFFVLLLLVALSVHSQQPDFHLNFANLGVGLFLPLEGQYMAELSIAVLQFGLAFGDSGLGVHISPFNYFGWFGSWSDITGTFSFINVGASWNFLGFLGIADTDFFIAPFATFNYLFMERSLIFNRYALSVGVQGGIRGNSGKIKYNIFSLDTGFRLIEGQGKFFLGIKYDPVMHIFFGRRK